MCTHFLYIVCAGQRVRHAVYVIVVMSGQVPCRLTPTPLAEEVSIGHVKTPLQSGLMVATPPSTPLVNNMGADAAYTAMLDDNGHCRAAGSSPASALMSEGALQSEASCGKWACVDDSNDHLQRLGLASCALWVCATYRNDQLQSCI